MSDSVTRFAAFRFAEYRYYVFTRLFLMISHQMQILVVSQHLYEITRDPLQLGFIGLSIFLPKFLFTLIGGQIADTYDRRDVLLVARVVQLATTAALYILVLNHSTVPLYYFICLFFVGTASAFDGPASSALFPRLVPREILQNAVTWNAATLQIAVISGPSFAGVLYALGYQALPILGWIIVMRVLSFIGVFLIRTRTAVVEKKGMSYRSALAGLSFIVKSPILLGAISLDLFGVLLGGAVALLPVYANDILHVGPRGLGLLRAAPAVGAGVMAVLIAYRPPFARVGRSLFVSVAVFGLATIMFGLSTYFPLSLISLILLGAADMVGMVIRGTLVQLYTPDRMRGRVGAANQLFIGASNELGEFESGVTARMFGTVPAVVAGGFGTLLVVVAWIRLFPDLKNLRTFTPLEERPSD